MLKIELSKTCLLLSLVSIFIGQGVAAPSSSHAALSGWVLDSSLLCGGYYQHPEWKDFPEVSPPWRISANSMSLNPEGLSKFRGDVRMQHGVRNFSAEEVQVLRQQGEVRELTANGSIHYLDPDLSIIGVEGHWTAQPDYLSIRTPHYYYYPRHARGIASQATLEDENILTLHDASYTTCSPGDSTWELKGKEIKLNESTGYGQAKHIRLKLANQTIFYWPYLQFPINDDRHSGFLYPSFGSTTQSGMEYLWPYYWNIAPNYDLTLTPKVLTFRGIELQNEFRYLTRSSDGIIQLHFLPHDRKYKKLRQQYRTTPPYSLPLYDPRVTALDTGDDRLGFRMHHHSHWNRWNFNIDYTYVSDDNYFYDLENGLNSSNTTKLAQEVSLTYGSTHWQHLWRAQSYHLLHPLFGPVNQEDYRRLPQWNVLGYYDHVHGLNLNFEGDVTHFDHPFDPYTGLALTQGTRLYARPAITFPYETWSGYVKPRIQADFLGYRLKLGQVDKQNNVSDNFNRVIPIFDIDSGLYFDKFYDQGYQQTLEPRLYYLYVPHKDQSDYPVFDSGVVGFNYYQLFRDNRFSGHDRVGDSNQLSFALTSRILNTKAEEKLRVTLGETIYFRHREVSVCNRHDDECRYREDPDRTKTLSPLIGDLLYTPNHHWYFGSGIEWNPNHARTDKAYLSAQWLPHHNQVFNVNYYWMRNDPFNLNELIQVRPLHQADASMLWPIHRQWDVLASYRYDIEYKRMIEVMVGIEYDTCCVAFQLVGNRYLKPNDGFAEPDYSNGIFFQIMFKGLSTFGSGSADDKLKRTIAQYKPFSRRNQFH